MLSEAFVALLCRLLAALVRLVATVHAMAHPVPSPDRITAQPEVRVVTVSRATVTRRRPGWRAAVGRSRQRPCRPGDQPSAAPGSQRGNSGSKAGGSRHLRPFANRHSPTNARCRRLALGGQPVDLVAGRRGRISRRGAAVPVGRSCPSVGCLGGTMCRDCGGGPCQVRASGGCGRRSSVSGWVWVWPRWAVPLPGTHRVVWSPVWVGWWVGGWDTRRARSSSGVLVGRRRGGRAVWCWSRCRRMPTPCLVGRRICCWPSVGWWASAVAVPRWRSCANGSTPTGG